MDQVLGPGELENEKTKMGLPWLYRFIINNMAKAKEKRAFAFAMEDPRFNDS